MSIYQGFYSIDIKVPIPPLVHHDYRGQPKIINTLKRMNRGDSFVIHYNQQGAVRDAARKLFIKVTTRKLDDHQLRVWRIK